MNAYQIAADRFDTISRSYNARKQALLEAIDALDDEFDAAASELAKYESKPGSPLPEYRTMAMI